MSYRDRLGQRVRDTGRPVRIALVGAGQMGRGFAVQVARMRGMEVSVIADSIPGRAEEAYRLAGRTDACTDGDGDVDVLAERIEAGIPVATTSAALAAALPVDILVEATGVPDVGAQVALAATLAGKHVGLLNVECDVTVGHILSRLAARAGTVYTVCRGDEPVEAKRLVDYARDLALEVVCAGKGKNNVLDHTATPRSVEAEARSKNMNPKMLSSFVDGSKAMIEMAALANGTDLEISRRGMNGPYCTVEDLHRTFVPEEAGGILDRAGVVDYCTGPVAPGVFVVVRADDPSVVEEMEYLKMGTGPYFTLYRPYHLASIEAPLSVAEAVLDGQVSLAPRSWRAEVVGAAKRRLKPGDVVDGIGGESVYGLTDGAEAVRADGLVPLGLLSGARVIRPVAVGEPLSYDDVELNEDSTIFALRRLQDQFLRTERDAPILAAGGLRI